MECCDSNDHVQCGAWYHPDPKSKAKPRRLIQMVNAEAVVTQTAVSGPVLWSLERWRAWIKRHTAIVGGNSE